MYQLAHKNINFDFIKTNLEKIFASRCKPVSEKSLIIWITEILNAKFSNEAIEKATADFLDDDELSLSLANFKRIVKNYESPTTEKKQFCPYCDGKGYVLGVKFGKDGKVVDEVDTVLNCVCGNRHFSNVLFMNEDNSNYHKTIVNDGYFLVFKDIVEKEKYLKGLKQDEKSKSN